MKKTALIAALCLVAAAAQAVPVEQPNRAWGQPLPDYCMVTFDSSNFQVAINERPGVPMPKDARPCFNAWMGNFLTFWRWFSTEK